MSQLAKDASKKEKEDPVFRGIAPTLHLVERMLSSHPAERPAASDVQGRMYQILREGCGISEPHCVHRYGGWDFGIGSLKMEGRDETGGVVGGSRRSSQLHKRTSSGGSTVVPPRRADSVIERERERSMTSAGEMGGGGFGAMKSLRSNMRIKVRPWLIMADASSSVSSAVHAKREMLSSY